MKTVSPEQMRELDSRSIKDAGIAGEVLMERAGCAAAEHILDFVSRVPAEHARRFVLLAGKGNNGGDAYVAARILSERDSRPVAIYSICPLGELGGDAAVNAGRVPGAVSVTETVSFPGDIGRGDIVVDGLLGTGISGPPRGPYSEWIEKLNSLDLPVISLDLPSGVDAGDGSVAGVAVRAVMTVTMGLPKTGMFIRPGSDLCGMLRCVDIGIPEKFIADAESGFESIFASDVEKLLGNIDPASHKNSRGRVLIAGGSRLYSGAPFLAAKGALRSGAGLVTVAVPDGTDVAPSCPASLIVRKIPGNPEGIFSGGSVDTLLELSRAHDCTVFGPGVTTDPDASAALQALSEENIPLVLDADGLNLLAGNPGLLPRECSTILTPHPGEMRRLAEAYSVDCASERNVLALTLAEKTGAVVLLKGHRSVTATPSGKIFVNSSGTPALATAGSGDILAGITGALLALTCDPALSVSAAAFIHGLASEYSPFGRRGMTADDLPRLIPRAMLSISPLA